jgi:EF-P beta-lysylation protein EpmB
MHRTPSAPQAHQLPVIPLWQQELAAAVRNPVELLQLLGLNQDLVPAAQAAALDFPLRVPRGYIQRMRPGDLSDPLLRQVLPTRRELEEQLGFSADPVGDLASVQRPGVLHKYRGRVLLVVTGACAIHCRYCFRRHFPYGAENAAATDWQPALDYLRSHPDVEEVILSGGDPLAMSDRKLGRLAAALAEIPHLQRLRIHSRLPVVLPSRVTDEFLDWFTGTRLTPVMVIHANHANELDSQVESACRKIRLRGATLLNQAVLLQGVNDDIDSLENLSRKLFQIGVLPYYLHLLDRVRGAAHFDVMENRARHLMAELAARLPGYLIPKLAREEAGKLSKTVILPQSYL